MTATTREDVRAWAGPAADEVTDEAADQIASLWDEIHAIYFPDTTGDDGEGDEPGAREASTGAAMLVLGDTTVAQAAREWQEAQQAALAAQDRLTGVIIAALDDGATQLGVSAQVGIARTTLARWLAPRR